MAILGGMRRSVRQFERMRSGGKKPRGAVSPVARRPRLQPKKKAHRSFRRPGWASRLLPSPDRRKIFYRFHDSPSGGVLAASETNTPPASRCRGVVFARLTDRRATMTRVYYSTIFEQTADQVW